MQQTSSPFFPRFSECLPGEEAVGGVAEELEGTGDTS